MLKFWAVRIGAPVAGRMPWLFYRLAWLVGWLAYHTKPKLRRRVLRNVAVACDGDREAARKAGVEVFRNIARYYVDIATLPHRDLAAFEREHVRVATPEHVEALFAPGPAIVVSAHLGNPELGLIAVIERGRSVVELVERLEPPELSEFFIRLREAGGGRVFEVGFTGMRACIDHLRDGGMVALLADRDIQGTGVCVNLLGRRSRVARGPFEMAQRTGATIIPLFLERDANSSLTVSIEEPFCVARGGDRPIEDAAQRWAADFEKHLRRNPAQWTVTEDYWPSHACRES